MASVYGRHLSFILCSRVIFVNLYIAAIKKAKPVRNRAKPVWLFGKWEVEVGSGKWEVGSGKWEVGSGKWKWKWEVGSGKWEVGSGKWEVEVGSGKWEVGSGKWEVGSGKWEVEVEVEVEVGSCIAFVAFPATAGPSCMDTVSLALATLQPGCQVMLQPVCYLSDVVQFPGPSGYGAALIEFVSASGVHGYYQMHPC